MSAHVDDIIQIMFHSLSRDMIAPPTFWNFEDGFKRMNYTLYNNYVLAKYQSLNR